MNHQATSGRVFVLLCSLAIYSYKRTAAALAQYRSGINSTIDHRLSSGGTERYKNAGSIQLVELSTVVIETGADNFVLKLARVPEAPGPVLANSAYVTWSVLCMMKLRLETKGCVSVSVSLRLPPNRHALGIAVDNAHAHAR